MGGRIGVKCRPRRVGEARRNGRRRFCQFHHCVQHPRPNPPRIPITGRPQNHRPIYPHRCSSALDDVIKITVFAADIRYRDEINRVRSAVFNEPYPASTQVAVAALVDPGWLVEIEAVAFVPD